MDWTAIRDADTYRTMTVFGIPNLIKDLGNSDKLDTKYKLSGSSSNTKANFKRTFQAYGFQKPNNFSSFNMWDIQMLLTRTRTPVLIRGEHKASGRGHAWVVDGLYQNAVIDPITDKAHGDGTFLHIIWGWGGKGNGYFKIGGTIDPSSKYSENGDWWVGNPYLEYDNDLKDVQYKNIEYVGDFKLK